VHNSSQKLIGISSSLGPEHFLNQYQKAKKQGHHALLLPPIKETSQLSTHFDQCSPHELWLDDQVITHTKTPKLQALELPSTFFYTSGSQGWPKVIVHSDQNLKNSAQASINALNNIPQQQKTHLTPLPLWHVGGMLCYYRAQICDSKLKVFKNDELIKYLLENPESLVVMVPTQLQRLLEQKIYIDHRHHHYYLGGGPLSKHLEGLIKDQNIQVTASYGMTETAGAIATGFEQIKIMEGIQLKCDEENRLHIKTDRLARYQVISNQLKEIDRDEDGHFATNDQAEITPKLKILGRLDETFVSGGENIDPGLIYRLLVPLNLGIVKVIPVTHKDLGYASYLFVSHLTPQKEALIQKTLPSHLKPFKVLKTPSTSHIKPTYQDYLKAAHDEL
jgi:O-succinylbenzoic acid--CoA ligase